MTAFIKHCMVMSNLLFSGTPYIYKNKSRLKFYVISFYDFWIQKKVIIVLRLSNTSYKCAHNKYEILIFSTYT